MLKIISQGKATMELRVCLFVWVLQCYLEFKWDGQAVYTNICLWSNSDVYSSKDNYSNNKEYLLGGSAFSVSSVMVPVLKKGNNSNLNKENKYFTTKLVKVRIKSEHCVGLLIVQFQCLQGHRLVI